MCNEWPILLSLCEKWESHKFHFWILLPFHCRKHANGVLMSQWMMAEDLLACFLVYQRWVREGKKPYYQSSSCDCRGIMHEKSCIIKHQFFYDTYHDNITDCGNGTYAFHIQTDDSWDGNDTWVQGKFTVDLDLLGEAYKVHITEQKATSW
jgi:hypothetical protein